MEIFVILHWYWSLLHSRAAPHHPLPPLCLSPSLPLWACRHYLMSLSFCAAGAGGGFLWGGFCYAEHQQTALTQPQSVWKHHLSDQIKYLTYNLYFFILPVSVTFSLCVLPSRGGLWDMFVRGNVTIVKHHQHLSWRTEQSGGKGAENRGNKELNSLWHQWRISQVLSRKRFNHPPQKQPKQWLASIAPPGSNVARYWPAPAGRRGPLSPHINSTVQ